MNHKWWIYGFLILANVWQILNFALDIFIVQFTFICHCTCASSSFIYIMRLATYVITGFTQMAEILYPSIENIILKMSGHICMLGVSILTLSAILWLDFGLTGLMLWGHWYELEIRQNFIGQWALAQHRFTKIQMFQNSCVTSREMCNYSCRLCSKQNVNRNTWIIW